jgi:hypothetical protein
MRSRRLRVALRIAFAGLVVLTGCNALIDVKDLSLAQMGPGNEAGAGDGDTTGDGMTTAEAGTESGPCGDTTNDSMNCGRCGHSCLGAPCKASTCDAIVLAMGLGQPDGIALGPNDVFVTTSQTETVFSVAKAGGAAKSLAMGQTKARGVALNGDTLYWANGDFMADDAGYNGGIWQCTLPSCGTKTLLAPGDFAAYPTFHGAAVFFSATNASEVRKAPASGGPSILLATPTQPFALAVDDMHVYYTSQQPVLQRAKIDGSGAGTTGETVGMTGDQVGFVTLDTQRVYWAYSDADGKGHVLSAAKAAPAAGTIAYGNVSENVFAVGVAVDATNVYWSTAGAGVGAMPAADGKVFTCPIAGCGGKPPTVLATGNISAGPMAVDDQAVYWVEFGSSVFPTGRVRKVAKP